MPLYLTDLAAADTAFELAALHPDSVVVLMQDGVAAANRAPDAVTCYALASDVERRGLSAALPDGVAQLSYADLVDLIVAHPVVNLG